jgi:hypothetical protein
VKWDAEEFDRELYSTPAGCTWLGIVTALLIVGGLLLWWVL